jgi:hypothetical protein
MKRFLGFICGLLLSVSAPAQQEGFNTFLNSLSAPATPLAGTEIIPCLQSGVTKGCTTALGFYNQTPAEAAVSCSFPTCITSYSYPEGNLFRYGGVGDHSTNNYTAITNALAVANAARAGNQGGGVVYVPSGTFRFTPPGLAAGTAATSASQSTSTGVFTTATQAFVAGTMVTLSGTVPPGFTAGVIYYVIAAGLTTTTVELSASVGGTVIVPTVSGSCTLTVETGIEVPSGVTIQGMTRSYAPSVLQPYQSGALFLDGSSSTGSGGYTEDITIKSLEIDYKYAIATNVVYINSAYSVLFRDDLIIGGFSNVPTYTNTVGFYGHGDANDIFDNVSIYGNATHVANSPVCLNIAANQAHLKFTHLDVEYCKTGIYNGSAASVVDFISPYIESTSTISYSHNATGTGQTNIIGGVMEGGGSQTYIVNIAGDNLLIEGLEAVNFTTAVFQTPAYSFAASKATSFTNVKITGMASGISSKMVATGANLAGIDFGENPAGSFTNGAYIGTGTAYNLKTLTSGSAANIFSFYAGNMIGVRVWLTAYQSSGYAATTAEYLFVIPGYGGLGTIGTPTLVGNFNAVNSTINTVQFSAPTLVNTKANEYTFGITATNSGTGGASSIIMVAKAEYVTYDGNVPAINIIVAD